MKEYIITYRDWDCFEKNTVINAYNKEDAQERFKERHLSAIIKSCYTGKEGCLKYVLIVVGIIIVLSLLLKGC